MPPPIDIAPKLTPRPLKKNYQSALFDVGGVLLDFSPDFRHLYHQILAENGFERSIKEIETAYSKMFATFVERSTREPDWEFHNSEWGAGLMAQLEIPDPDVKRLIPIIDEEVLARAQMHVPDQVPGVLEVLGEKGVPLGIVSNWDTTLIETLKHYHLLHHFRSVIGSADVGVWKPNTRIFEIALEELGFDPNTTLYIGDHYFMDVVGSTRAGLDCVLLDSKRLYDFVDWPKIRGIEQFLDFF